MNNRVQLCRDISVRDFIGNAFCLSVDDERWNQFSTIFKHYFGVAPRRFIGFSDNTITDHPVLKCTIGHGAIIRMAKALDLPFVTIFEDDAFPREDAVQQLEKCFKNIPNDAKIVMWGYLRPHNLSPVNANMRAVSGTLNGSHAYTVFKNAYDEYLSIYPETADRYWPIITPTYTSEPVIFIQCNTCESLISKMLGYEFCGSHKDPPKGFNTIGSILSPYVVHLHCGLGNQLFQYAFGKGLEHKYRVPVKYTIENISHTDMYNLRTDIFSSIDLDTVSNVIAEGLPEVKEDKSFFDNYDSYTLPKCARYEGVYQDDKYFKFIADELRKELKFPAIPKSNLEVQAKMRAIGQCKTSVCVHVRRGDYIGHKWQLDIKYYATAMDYIRNNVDNPTFFVFGEDLEFMQNNFTDKDTVIMGYSDVNWHDMVLMGKCKHAIISNSTFAWWAVWLGTSNNNIVICPTWGIKDGDLELDPCCDNWYKVAADNTTVIPPKDSLSK